VETSCNAQRITRPSTCEAPETECSTDAACGTCNGSEVCTRGRCLHFIGLPTEEYPRSQADLGRGFYDVGEGMECTVDVDGDLERVEAGISSDGLIDGVTLSVFAECAGRFTKVAEQSRKTPPGAPSSLGAWTLDPPVSVKKGTTVRVVFRADGAVYGARAAIQQIARRDAASACRFYSGHGPRVTGGKEWDLLGRLGIHPR